ncbi:hypothetical protein [[Mannheimia] succiniciproducens]|uniref:YfhO family protein n=1 Tax=Mannheimia succiniciproducens (strain KCTC 0769BP / MBEL55E) TaxID=221988 RepID=Q65UT8_MANSM|nr:hypothetical protein [[Mannheimia] succiniciproducens]AAU37272.1 unknown [[Mannheimia] succiniciproducens MBEL55E]
MNKYLKSDFIFSLFLSIAIMFICLYFEKSFFFVDDAQNEFLPFTRQIGNVWLNGEIPFILKNTFIGSNTMIDIHRAIFLPQNIFLSILSVKITSLKIISIIAAFINLFVMSFSALKLSEAFSLTKAAGIVLAFLFCINPIFLYFYLESWWNAAAGQAWFVASLASVAWLMRAFSIKRLLLNVITVLSIFASGWPHSVLVYGFLALIFSIFLYLNKRHNDLILFVLISFSIILIAIPLYSEYVISGDLINRQSFKFNNVGNFLSTTLNQLLLTFNVTYYHFMHRYGGYSITHIPMGYSSIYILLLICFGSLKNIARNPNSLFLLVLCTVFFILTQTPTEIGPFRYPFRFTPYFSEVLTMLSIFSLEKLGIVKTRARVFLVVLLLSISLLLSIFSLEENFGKYAILQFLFFAVTTWYVVRYNSISLKSGLPYTAFIFLLMLLAKDSVIGYLSFPDLKNSINMENNYSQGGYILSLTNGKRPKNNLEDLNSTHFMLYGLKSINGASPVGNKYISKTISTRSSQAFFNAKETILGLSKTYKDKCYFDLFGIDTVILNKKDNSSLISQKLSDCGFSERKVKSHDVIYFLRNDFNAKGSVSYHSDTLSINQQISLKNNSEFYQLSGLKGDELIFNRVYWYGYRAYINDKEIPLLNYDGLLRIILDHDYQNGVLRLEYFPKSWKYALLIALSGFLLLLFSVGYMQRMRKWVSLN